MEQVEGRGFALPLCHKYVGLWAIVSHESGGRSPGLEGGDRDHPAGPGSQLKWCASADGGGAGDCVHSQAPGSESESDWMGGRRGRVWAARRWALLKEKLNSVSNKNGEIVSSFGS